MGRDSVDGQVSARFETNLRDRIFFSLIGILAVAAIAGGLAMASPVPVLAQGGGGAAPTADDMRAEAVALSRELGALMIAVGAATPESVAEAMEQLQQDLQSTVPTEEELDDLRAMARGVIRQASAAAKGSGDDDRAQRLLQIADDLARAETTDAAGALMRRAAGAAGDGLQAGAGEVAAATGGSVVQTAQADAFTPGKQVAQADTAVSGTQTAQAGAAASGDDAAQTDAPVRAPTKPDAVTIVFDASNSMWGQIDERPKIEIAREALAEFVSQWSGEADLGLLAFGHRRESDCGDIETLRPPGPSDPLKFVLAVGGISPKGKSPITAAVRQAAEELRSTERPATVVLFSDGVETFGGDPCALAGELEQAGVGFTAHVIGFGVEEDDAQLACLAEATGGLYLAASNTAELSRALSTVRTVATQPENAHAIVFEAVAADTGEMLRTGVVWRVISLETEEAAPITAGVARPSLPLDPGRYFVEASVGDVKGRTEITVEAGKSETVRVTLALDRAAPAVGGIGPILEAEGNDTFGMANATQVDGVDTDTTADGSSYGKAVEVSASGRLGATVDQDRSIWRRLSVSDQGELTMTLAETPAGSAVSARVWSAEKGTLSGWLAFTTGSEVFDLPAAGEYILELHSAKAGGDLSLDMAFAATGDGFEPNDSFGRRAVMPLDEPFGIALLPKGDVDWFEITVEDQGRLSIGQPEASGVIDLALRLWNADKGTLTGWLPLKQGADAAFDLPSSGTYVLEIRDGNNDARSPALIRLVPEFVPTGDSHEPNGSFGTAAAAAMDTRVTATIFPKGDSDWYRLRAADQGALQIGLTAPEEIQPVVRLWNNEKGTLTGFDPFEDGTALFDLKAPGDYLLEVRDKDNAGFGTASYSLDLAFSPTGDTAEPNDRFETAARFEPGKPISGAFLPRGDADWYRFSIGERGSLVLKADEVPEGLEPSVRLWNAEKSTVTGFLPVGAEPLALDLGPVGDYWLEFREKDDDGRSPDSFVIATEFVSAVSVADERDNGVLTGTVFPVGDADWFSLTAATAGLVTFTPLELPAGLDPAVRVWSAEKGTLSGWLPLLVNGNPAPAEFELKNAGVFRIELRDGSNDARSTERYRIEVNWPGKP